MELLEVPQLKVIRVPLPLLSLDGELEGDDLRVRLEGLLLEEANQGEGRRGAPHKGVQLLLHVGRVTSVGNPITRRTTAGGSRISVCGAEVRSTGSPTVRSRHVTREELPR